MHFSQGKIKQNSCLIHVMNILFSSNTLSRCFPGEIHISHIHKHTGSECENYVGEVLHFASPLMRVSENNTSGRLISLCEVRLILMKTSLAHLICRIILSSLNSSSVTQSLSLLNCILDHKMPPFLSPSFTTTEFLFLGPLIGSDKKAKHYEPSAT